MFAKAINHIALFVLVAIGLGCGEAVLMSPVSVASSDPKSLAPTEDAGVAARSLDSQSAKSSEPNEPDVVVHCISQNKPGDTAYCQAKGKDNTGSYIDITLEKTTGWKSGDPAVVEIVGIRGPYAEVVLSNNPGSAPVSVTSPLGTAQESVNVINAVVSGFRLVPELGVSTPVGVENPIRAILEYYHSDDKFQIKYSADVTETAVFTAADPLIGNFVAAKPGVFVGIAAGRTLVSATISYQGKTIKNDPPLELQVTSSNLTGIVVNPRSPSIPLGSTWQFKATGVYADGTQFPLSSVAWTSDNGNIVGIDNTGSAVGKQLGSATIIATVGSISGSTVATVADIPEILVVEPDPLELFVGQSRQLQAFLTTANADADQRQNVTHKATWSINKPYLAWVDSYKYPGQIMGMAAADAGMGVEVVATMNGKKVAVPVVVRPGVVVSQVPVSIPVDPAVSNPSTTTTLNTSSTSTSSPSTTIVTTTTVPPSSSTTVSTIPPTTLPPTTTRPPTTTFIFPSTTLPPTTIRPPSTTMSTLPVSSTSMPTSTTMAPTTTMPISTTFPVSTTLPVGSTSSTTAIVTSTTLPPSPPPSLPPVPCITNSWTLPEDLCDCL